MENLKFFFSSSDNSWTGFVARLFAGIVLFPHGAQKLLGIFGGSGPAATIQFFTEVMHIPLLVAWLVIAIEFFGAVFLVLGVFSRLWSVLISFLFLGIIFVEQGQHGFFMNWMNNQQGEGFEYSLLMIGLCVVVAITGGGKYSFFSFHNSQNS